MGGWMAVMHLLCCVYVSGVWCVHAVCACVRTCVCVCVCVLRSTVHVNHIQCRITSNRVTSRTESHGLDRVRPNACTHLFLALACARSCFSCAVEMIVSITNALTLTPHQRLTFLHGNGKGVKWVGWNGMSLAGMGWHGLAKH